MVRTAKYELIELLLGVPLAEELQRWRAEGLTTSAIAQRIRLATKVPVTGETIRQWLMLIEESAA